MKPARIVALSIVTAALLAVPASAQMVVSAKSGVINLTDGRVLLNDQAIESTVTHYPEMKEGSTLRTEDGRAEILLTPGVVLRLGDHGAIRLVTNRLIDTRVELLSGAAVLEADEIVKETNVSIVLKDATITLPKAGLYRFDTAPPDVKVYKGEVAIAIKGQTTFVGSGRVATLADEVAVSKFNTDDTDALDRWSFRRGEMLAAANVSAANSLLKSGYYPTSGSLAGCGSAWVYNPYFAMNTFLPCNGYLSSPYGYRFWSPRTVTQVYYRPPAYSGGGYGGFSGGSYSGPSMTSGGYSGTMASPSSGGYSGGSVGSSSSAGAAASAGAGGSSGGHGGGGGGGGAGGHGH
jgi:hypothetical protein